MKEFEGIYDEFFLDVYKYIVKLTRDPSIAEDIVQDTFIKALGSLDSIRDETKIKSWLLSIAKNTYLSRVSRDAKTISLQDIEVISLKDQYAELADKDSARCVRKILHEMKEPYKETFYLRVFAGLSFREIAEVFEKNEDWARQTFHRSRLLIKEKM
ncbi:MAG: RNA polymerase sigma factor [Candidatus Saccharimonadales bacterium]